MKISPSHPVLNQTSIDSGSLGVMGYIAHRFSEPGEYRGDVYKDEKHRGTVHIRIEQTALASQLNLDLSTVAANDQKLDSCSCKTGNSTKTHFELNPAAYAVFHASDSVKGYSFHFSKTAATPQPTSFDSQALHDGDIFAAVLVRPGVYSLANTGSKAKGEITVSYPVRGKQPFKPPQPANVECTPSGFKPAKLQVAPMQGMVYNIKTPSRIMIELSSPIDRPKR